jgi:hypothetical protein
MNHKIAAYIEHQRNLPEFTEVNEDSGSLEKMGKAGKEFEQELLEAVNNHGLFDTPPIYKLLAVLAVIVNVCLFLSRGNS